MFKGEGKRQNFWLMRCRTTQKKKKRKKEEADFAPLEKDFLKRMESASSEGREPGYLQWKFYKSSIRISI